ncbi:C2H2 zinc finger transcription factor [Fusarium heterosporum]|uniref:C2H2 zinc finger transcription factor n=1 Tax=Fusarium heterosporum TaxID=42747 RepID=A0A8H5WEA8_FUSHE|nr:C2H2 zinc finger transcription factor [Fusarium heterosporum]
MNTDDENVEPRPGSRSIDLTSRPDPPGSSKPSFVGGLSSSPKPEANMNSRRRSNTSFESYGSSYGSSQPGPSSNTPMRPFTAGATTVEPHVKLTPITGKISKAKKGVPVHRCNQCSKTFSRAEHLRRHQLSHSPAELRCPVPNCNKPFYRKDLLDRHVQKHDQDDQDATSDKHTTVRSSPRAPKQTRTPVLRTPDFSDPQTSVHSNNDPTMSGQWTTRHTSGSSQNCNTRPSTTDDYPTVSCNYPLPTAANTSLSLMYPSPGNMSGISAMTSIPVDVTPELRWPENPALSSSASTSQFSTPSQTTGQPQFPVLVANGPWMTPPTYTTATSDMSATSMDDGTYPGTYAYDSTPPQAYPAVFNMDLPLSGYTEDTAYTTINHIPTCTVRSMSPLMAVAQSETLVAVPSLPTSDGVLGLAGCSSMPPDGSSLLSNDDLKPSLPTATSEAIPRYLEVYWEKVHPMNPIIHEQTFGDVSDEDAEELEALQCAMAALATQFIPEADDRMKGAQLHAYAWQKSKVFTQGEKWSLPVQQTVALCEYYARFRGRKPHSHQSSPRFASLYHRLTVSRTATRLCHWPGLLFSKNPSYFAYGYDDKTLGSTKSSIMGKAEDKKRPENYLRYEPGDTVCL